LVPGIWCRTAIVSRAGRAGPGGAPVVRHWGQDPVEAVVVETAVQLAEAGLDLVLVARRARVRIMGSVMAGMTGHQRAAAPS